MSCEVHIFLKLGRHPRLLRFYGQCVDGMDQFLITEFAELGSLSDAFEMFEGQITMAQSITISQQIAAGMEHRVVEGLIHCDLAARSRLLKTMLNTLVKVTDLDCR